MAVLINKTKQNKMLSLPVNVKWQRAIWDNATHDELSAPHNKYIYCIDLGFGTQTWSSGQKKNYENVLKERVEAIWVIFNSNHKQMACFGGFFGGKDSKEYKAMKLLSEVRHRTVGFNKKEKEK